MSIIPSDALKAFEFNGTDVRALLIDDEPWWIARDVCAVLEIKNAADALASLDEDEKGVATTDTPGGPQQLATVNESGLYTLTFRSRKKQAKTFKRWVTHEVLPTLRKTGTYTVAQPAPTGLEEQLALAMQLIKAKDQINALTVSHSDLAQRVADLEPKAEGYDDLIAAEGCFDMSAVAKILSPVTGNIGRTRLLNLLRGMGIILQGSTLPEQKYIERGYFQVRTDIVNGKAVASTVATPKGLRWLQFELREDRPTLTHPVRPVALPSAPVVHLPRQLRGGEAS